MAIEMPTELQPVLQLYGINWPDINEDSIVDLGKKLGATATAIVDFSDAIENGLEALTELISVDALNSFKEVWAEITNGTVEPFVTDVGTAAEEACQVIADAIAAYKTALIGRLMWEVGSDLFLIAAAATGVGAPVALPALMAKKAAIRLIAHVAEHEILAALDGYLWGIIDDKILKPVEAFARNFGEEAARPLHAIVRQALPDGPSVTPRGGDATAVVKVEHNDIIDAGSKLKTSYRDLVSAINDLKTWEPEGGYRSLTPIPEHDTSVRHAVEKILDWVKDGFVGELQSIGDEVVDKIIDTLDAIYTKFIDQDSLLGSIADELRDRFDFPAPSLPYYIDRSTRPPAMDFWDADPELITGPGQSDARDRITVIDLPDAPDQVITGPGVSDARYRIQPIILEEAEPEVVTGAAVSDARNNIRVIDLPDAAV